ncbi:hypothetical protein [Nocardioides mangrovi]|uniref:EthD domain-containing protein n=1 Tax=Nocardioides mangrovi TaxID=2874580 RepID=A0ABS7UFV9_9ACTN|nr:hypothetical protein [Nocardioides mangrovi]MBZ5739527.1 hypothetical protein [Nocardioides mangrovi]
MPDPVRRVHAGLVLVLGEPAALPPRPGEARWQALDGRPPTWLTTYDVPDVAAARDHARAVARATLEVRTYEQLDEHTRAGRPDAERPPLLLTVSVEVPPELEDELHRWYVERHIPLLHRVDGWWRTRRYRLVDGPGPRWLAVHEIAGQHVFDDPEYAAAVTPDRRDQIMAGVTRRERRLFAAPGRPPAPRDPAKGQ